MNGDALVDTMVSEYFLRKSPDLNTSEDLKRNLLHQFRVFTFNCLLKAIKSTNSEIWMYALMAGRLAESLNLDTLVRNQN